MDDDLFATLRADVGGPGHPWIYRRSTSARLIEWASVCGEAVALPPHFHDEDQLTFVVDGRRSFLVDDEPVTLSRGRGFTIKSGTIHRSLPESGGVVCLNLYVREGEQALRALHSLLTAKWQQGSALCTAEIEATLQLHGCARTHDLVPVRAVGRRRSVGAEARAAGLSREAFSRKFRRIHGVPPSLFSSMSKLNDARALLRAGETPAAVAAGTGFPDQSHLGRAFRHAFGVPPGCYRSG